jgi:hypothetical protein
VHFLNDPDLEAALVLEFPRQVLGSMGARAENQEVHGVQFSPDSLPGHSSVKPMVVWRAVPKLDIVREKKSTSMLLSRIISYLEHDQKRRTFLLKYPGVDAQVDEKSSIMHVRVPLLKTHSHRSSIYASQKIEKFTG